MWDGVGEERGKQTVVDANLPAASRISLATFRTVLSWASITEGVSFFSRRLRLVHSCCLHSVEAGSEVHLQPRQLSGSPLLSLLPSATLGRHQVLPGECFILCCVILALGTRLSFLSISAPSPQRLLPPEPSHLNLLFYPACPYSFFCPFLSSWQCIKL